MGELIFKYLKDLGVSPSPTTDVLLKLQKTAMKTEELLPYRQYGKQTLLTDIKYICQLSPQSPKNKVILSVLANPRSLKHLCRLKIRKCMGRLRLRCPVFMSFLPLPNRLKAYILYKEYDLYGQESFTET